MATKMVHHAQQGQGLALCPQLQHSIKLLALTHSEMAQKIAEEMVENPMLEDAEANTSESPCSPEASLRAERLERENREARAENFEGESIVPKDDFDWHGYVSAAEGNAPSLALRREREKAEEKFNYENIISRGHSLSEHLEWQLRMEDISPQEYFFALEIVHNLDEDGYLSTPWEGLVAQSLHTPPNARQIWERIKKLDPVGCACRSLTECLLTQAQALEERSPLVEKIITHHLADLQGHNYQKIARDLNVTTGQIDTCAQLIKNFHPRPGRLIGQTDTHYIIPDIYIVQAGGEFVVKVNDDGIPRLKISRLYRKILQQKHAPKESKYVREKLDAAAWLIKSIHHRQKTIHRVASAIVAQQQAFFQRGPEHLRPMILRDIAGQIGVHESTVSRATSGKYMHTPLGIFELKYFFGSGLGGRGGTPDITCEVLKIKIKNLINGENPKRPLSDQKIAVLLDHHGLGVARRTVAKYREELGLPPSPKRKVARGEKLRL